MPSVGAVFPPLTNTFSELKTAFPIIGAVWVYSALAIIIGALLLGERDLSIARFLNRGKQPTSSMLRKWGVYSVIASILATVFYYWFEIRTGYNAALWVFVSFPVLYAVVLLTASLGLAWLERAAQSRA